MQHLSNLVGEVWLNAVLAETRRRKEHPLRFPLVQRGEAWSRWRETFNAAIGIVTELLANNTPARQRLIGKIRDRRQFLSTVPEIIWAARLHQLGMVVDVEPIVGRRGPDMRFTANGFTAHAEVYAPVFEADEFDWGDDLAEDLEPLAVGFHVSTQLLPERSSKNRSIIRTVLRATIKDMISRGDRAEYRLYIRNDRSVRMEPRSGYVTLDCDPVMEEERDLLFVTDLYNCPDQSGVTVGADAKDSLRDRRELLTDLGQLQAGANLLILDTTRDFIEVGMISRASDSAFARHPELSAVAVSSWGVYRHPLDGHYFVEEYDFIVNPLATAPFPPDMLEAMGRLNLLDGAR